MADQPLAVIDIGSNSGRVLVVRLGEPGSLQVLADAGAPLRLVRELRDTRRFGERAMAHTLDVLRGFRGIARAAGARRLIAVATAAVREADNGPELVALAREALDCDVQIVDGQQEARYGFLGAVHGVPVADGLVLDVGGGSLQVVQFKDRALQRAWTLPLGALRLSDRFLPSDPPTRAELESLRRYVEMSLQNADVATLGRGERLVGTGGTIRNRAKVDRRSRSKYPISRLHGYAVGRVQVRDLAARVAATPMAARGDIPGLSADRADPIAGGALVVNAVMEHVKAHELLASGQGLREGLALAAFGQDVLPPPADVRAVSVRSLAARFNTWDPAAADRRCAIVRHLLAALLPDGPPEDAELVGLAAVVLDVGRSVDYYNRHTHTAAVLTAADLSGFSHHAIARLSALVRLAGDPGAGIKAYKPLLATPERDPIARHAAVLDLADEIERAAPPGGPVPLTCQRSETHVAVAAPLDDPHALDGAAARFARAFGLPVRIAAQPAGAGLAAG